MKKHTVIHFLNTRPLDKAEKLTQALTVLDNQICIKHLPLLNIVPLDLSVADLACLQQMTQYDLLVCVSPTAVNLAKTYLADYSKTHSPPVLAVGNATKAALKQQGIHAITPLPQQMNNEGMLALPLVADLCKTNKVLMLCGRGGRKLLVNALRDRGIQVDRVALYERTEPKNLSQAFANIAAWSQIVLISSGEAWRHWLSVCSNLTSYQYVVLGKRIYTLVHDLGCDAVLVNDLDAKTIYDVLEKFK